MFEKLCRKLYPRKKSTEDSVPADAAVPVEEALRLALLLFDAGRLEEAEQAYLDIIRLHPEQHVATLQLGLIARRMGDARRSFALIERAVQLNPGFAQAHNHLGNALAGERRVDEALKCYERALLLAPDYAAPHFNIGSILLEKGETEGAISRFEAAVSINPSFAEAHNSLGIALKAVARQERAVESYRLALQLKPDLFEALNNLAIELKELKRPEEALELCQRAFLLRPESAELENTRGLVLSDLGRFEPAMACFHRAIELNPAYAAPHNNIGIILKKLQRCREAIPHYLRALEISPGYLEALSNLALALMEVGELTPAIAACTQALKLRPDYLYAHYSMGLVLVAQGRVPEALAEFKLARCGNSLNLGAHSNLLFSMNYLPDVTQEEIYRESRRWDESHCDLARSRRRLHDNKRDPERPLRIGFVSPDLRKHSVSFFFEPLLAQCRRPGAGTEYICYADVTDPDTMTSHLKGLAHRWVDVVGLSDEALAKRVREDRVDILFDLAGHTGHRLMTFAEKPAPVQVAWLGYPNTTGLDAIDYRLTDAVADPEGESDRYHSERLYRMPDGFLCYAPHQEAPKVNPLPAATNGFVTFGSFNNFAKVTPEVIRLWARLLELVADARLIMKGRSFADLPTRRNCEQAFASYGIDPARLELRPWEEADLGHLSAYGRIDIALDTFPYNGTTTTCEALWMGVPVVTLLGERHAARVGASILSRLDLEELVARDCEEYLATACRLAGDVDRLASQRALLRGVMARSPLCDARLFADSLEGVCREMWRRWCRETDGGS